MIDDVFCKIIKGELKSDVVYKDDDFWVIKDINPQAPVHLLVIPVKHFLDIDDFSAKGGSLPAGRRGASGGKDQSELLGRAFILAHKMAKDSGLERGYRLIVNDGQHGGKLVPHFHIHILGGKALGTKIVK